MTDEPHINFSKLKKYFPYTFTLHNWARGKRYKRFYYLFDASVEFPHATRSFKLCLPAYKIESALAPWGMKYKRAHTVKITFEKLDKGEINITNLEVIK